MTKRALSLLLAVLMLVSVWVPAYADEGPDPAAAETAAPAEEQAEQPAAPAEQPADPPAEEPAEQPSEPPAEEPAEPTEQPAEPPVEEPAEPTEEPAELPVEEPAEPVEPAEEPVDDPAAEEEAATIDEALPVADAITISYVMEDGTDAGAAAFPSVPKGPAVSGMPGQENMPQSVPVGTSDFQVFLGIEYDVASVTGGEIYVNSSDRYHPVVIDHQTGVVGHGYLININEGETAVTVTLKKARPTDLPERETTPIPVTYAGEIGQITNSEDSVKYVLLWDFFYVRLASDAYTLEAEGCEIDIEPNSDGTMAYTLFVRDADIGSITVNVVENRQITIDTSGSTYEGFTLYADVDCKEPFTDGQAPLGTKLYLPKSNDYFVDVDGDGTGRADCNVSEPMSDWQTVWTITVMDNNGDGSCSFRVMNTPVLEITGDASKLTIYPPESSTPMKNGDRLTARYMPLGKVELADGYAVRGEIDFPGNGTPSIHDSYTSDEQGMQMEGEAGSRPDGKCTLYVYKPALSTVTLNDPNGIFTMTVRHGNSEEKPLASGEKVEEDSHIVFHFKDAANAGKYTVISTDTNNVYSDDVDGMPAMHIDLPFSGEVWLWKDAYRFYAVPQKAVTWADSEKAVIGVRYREAGSDIYEGNYIYRFDQYDPTLPAALPQVPAGMQLEVVLKAGYKLEGTGCTVIPGECFEDSQLVCQVFAVTLTGESAQLTVTEDPENKPIPVTYTPEEAFETHWAWDGEQEIYVIGPSETVPGMEFWIEVQRGWELTNENVVGGHINWMKSGGSNYCIVADEGAQALTITATKYEGLSLEIVAGPGVPEAVRSAVRLYEAEYTDTGAIKGAEIIPGTNKVYPNDELIVEVADPAYVVTTMDGDIYFDEELNAYIYRPSDDYYTEAGEWTPDGKLTLTVKTAVKVSITGKTGGLYTEGGFTKDGDLVSPGEYATIAVKKGYALSVTKGGKIDGTWFACDGQSGTVFKGYGILVDENATALQVKVSKSSASFPTAKKVTYKGATEGLKEESDKYFLPNSSIYVGLAEGYCITSVANGVKIMLDADTYVGGSAYYIGVNEKAKSLTVTIGTAASETKLVVDGENADKLFSMGEDWYEVPDVLPNGTFQRLAYINVYAGYQLKVVSGADILGQSTSNSETAAQGNSGNPFFQEYYLEATSGEVHVQVVKDDDPPHPVKVNLVNKDGVQCFVNYEVGNEQGSFVNSNEFFVGIQADGYTAFIDKGEQITPTYGIGDDETTFVYFHVPAGVDEVTVTVRPKTLATPGKATLTPASTGLQINWTGVKHAEKYRILYKTSKKGSWKKLTDVNGSQTEYIWENAKSNTTYYVTIQCLRSDGKTTDSAYDKTGVSLKYIAAPKAPTAALSGTGIKISWKKVSGASYYQVYEQKNGTWEALGSPTKSTSFTWKEATGNEPHVFAVRCTDKTGKTYNSAIGPASTEITIVDKPQNVKVENTADGVKVSWDAVTNAVKYQVYYRTSTKKKWTPLGDAQTGTENTLKVKSGSSYYYTVCCVTEDGKAASPYGDATVKTKYVDAPKAPTAVLADTGIKISWKKVSGASYYQVYVQKNGTWEALLSKPTKSTSFTWEGSTGNEPHVFAVRCTDKGGKTYYSAIGPASTEITIVDKPQNVKVENTADGVKVSWDAVAGAVKYQVYYRTSTKKKWTPLGDAQTGTENTLKVKSGSSYYYTVRCVTEDGKAAGPYGGATAKTKYVAAPTVKAAIVSTGIKLSWSKVSGASKYQLYYREGAGEWQKLVLTKSTSYTWEGAKPGVAYTFTAEATDKNGNALSARKEDGTAITMAAKPELSFEMTEGGLKISWAKDGIAAQYRVYYGTKKSSLKKLGDPVPDGSCTLPGAKAGKTYYFSVRPLTESGALAGPYSAVVSFKVPKT